MSDKCFTSLNGYAVKDTIARIMAEETATAFGVFAEETGAALGAFTENNATLITDVAGLKETSTQLVDDTAGLKDTTDILSAQVKKNVMVMTARMYVDGVNGSDENDGKTPETAFRTVQRFLQQLNEGETDVRCYVTSPGVYDVDYNIFSHIALHIGGTVDGVVLNFISHQTEVVFYNCHINFSNITIRTANEKFRFEDSTCGLTNINFDTSMVIFYHCHAEAENSVCKQVYFYGSTGVVNGITTTAVVKAPIYFDRGCSIRLAGAVAFADRSDSNNECAIWAKFSCLWVTTQNFSGSGWGIGIQGAAALIHLPQAYYTALGNIATTPAKQENAITTPADIQRS